MSSDSEDDCYGNIAQKLQSIKSKYEQDNIKTTELLDTSLPEPSKGANKIIEIADNTPSNVCQVSKDDSDGEEISLDTIIAQNMKKRTQRSKGKRSFDNSDISTDNIVTTRSRKRTRASKAETIASIDLDSSQNVSDLSAAETTNDSVNTTVSMTRGRGRGRSKSRRGKNSTSTRTTNVASVSTTANNSNSTSAPAVSTNSNISTLNRSRGSQRGRNRRGRQNRRSHQITFPDLISAMFGFGVPHSFPTYSVGNTDEYPDECCNQPLFKDQSKTDDIVIVGENEPEMNDSLDENEELSVKVYWQSRECVKFTIRRFQKLQPIFDFFANRENVSHDKLFFTYNDKILKMDDTPDSITYSIVKFIDGGIVNQSVSNIVQNDTKAQDGIKLKFQCQNVKKPYELFVKPEEKLAVAMMRCAEHLEKPLEKLKFLFDGDTITGKNTPKELDLEGGECIDVKIIS